MQPPAPAADAHYAAAAPPPVSSPPAPVSPLADIAFGPPAAAAAATATLEAAAYDETRARDGAAWSDPDAYKVGELTAQLTSLQAQLAAAEAGPLQRESYWQEVDRTAFGRTLW